MNIENINTKLQAIDLPTRKNESWKYTPLKKWFDGDWGISQISSPLDTQKAGSFENYLHFFNGELSTDNLPEGIELKELEINSELLGRLNKSVDSAKEITPIQLASLKSAYSIKVTKETASPIHLKFSHLGENNMSSVYLDFHFAKNSEAHFVEEIIDENKTSSISFIRKTVKVEADARSRFYQLTSKANKSRIFLENKIEQAKNSSFQNYSFSFDAELERNDLEIDLNESHSQCDLFGLYIKDGEKHFDQTLLINHLAPETFSNQLFKGVLNDKAKSAFTGKVYIAKDSQKVNATQLNQNLIVSDKATAHSRPQLEIFADDVKCSHGSATAQISEDQRFYLESRGLNKKRSNHLLSMAYTQEILMAVENKKINSYIKDILHSKLAEWNS